MPWPVRQQVVHSRAIGHPTGLPGPDCEDPDKHHNLLFSVSQMVLFLECDPRRRKHLGF